MIRIIILFIYLYSCSTTQSKILNQVERTEVDGVVILYRCKPSRIVSVRFNKIKQKAYLTDSIYKNIELERQKTASGFRYTGHNIEIMGKDISLIYNVGKKKSYKCLAES